MINADALQLYRGLPVATNKVSAEEMEGVAHHLLGCVGIDDEPWTIGRFTGEAQRIVSDIHSRGKVPIVVGGTQYYVQSLLLVNNMITPDTKVLEDAGSERKWPILGASAEDMMEKLQSLDPEAAEWWHPHDARKIRRSLEICLTSGRRVSEIYSEQKCDQAAVGQAQHERYDSLCFHLHAEKEVLNERLDQRVDSMIERGLLDEVRLMHDAHFRLRHDGQQLDDTKGIWVAIGYKEFAGYVELAASDGNPAELERLKAESCERTKIATRQYATRQARWAKNKLIPALQCANCLDRFFALDATCGEAWESTVMKPAFLLTSKFLNQAQLPDSRAIGVTAQVLAETNKATRIKTTCEICQVTTLTAATWEDHLKSKKHRNMTRPRKDP